MTAPPGEPPPTGEDPAEHPPRGSEPGETRDDPGAGPVPGPPPTAEDPPPAPAVDTREEARPGPDPDRSADEATSRLPPPLAGYTLVGALEGGGQAVVRHCQTPDGDDVVVKRYHQTRPDRAEVWRRWRAAATHPHIVALVGEPFDHDGRSYEVTPYHPGGTLDDRQRAGPVSPDDLRTVLSQIGDALHTIHHAPLGKLVHRDIKPSNLLVVRREPLHVALTDFGIAVPQTHTHEDLRTVARTAHYAAPEAPSQSHLAQDWWSLGITVLELLQGRHPFRDPGTGQWWSDREIDQAVRLGRIPVDDAVDDRWRLLLRGLFTYDPDDRWAWGEVQEWLAGGSPEVRDTAATPEPPPVRRVPFAFAGTVVDTPVALGALVGTHWSDAVILMFGSQPPRWRELVAWAGQVSPELHTDLEAIHEGFVVPGVHADRCVAELLVALDRSAAPVFRAHPAHDIGLSELAARRIADPDDEDAEDAVARLFASGALASLARLRGAGRLALIDSRWQQLDTVRVRAVGTLPPEVAAGVDTPTLRAYLLRVSAEPDAAADLAAAAAAAATPRNMRVRWFRQLVEDAHGEDAPAYHVLVRATATLAALPGNRLDPEDVARARRAVAQDARPPTARPPGAVGWGRRLRRGGPTLVGASAYGGLVLVVGAGVAAGTSVLQGVLIAVVLAVAGWALHRGLVTPRHRWTDVLLTGWAGTVLGLGPAALAGGVAGALLGAMVGWPVFWVSWLVAMVVGAVLGAAR